MCCNIYNWWQRQAHMHILDTPWVGVSPPSSKNALATIENHVVLLYVPRYKYTCICTVISTIGFNSTDRIFWFYWHILWSSMWCKDTKKYWFNGCLISLACRGLKTHRVDHLPNQWIFNIYNFHSEEDLWCLIDIVTGSASDIICLYIFDAATAMRS